VVENQISAGWLKKVLHRNGRAIGSMNYCDRVLLQRKAPEMRVISVK
jgi:hypothetical protein